MSKHEILRQNLIVMVEELRSMLHDIGDQGLPQTSVVSSARDRLRYISALTEQSAGQTLNAVEAITDRLHSQKSRAAALAGQAQSPEVRDFLLDLQAEHELSGRDTNAIIEAQAFQDLVGQVINKLMGLVQKLEDNLVHLLVEDEASLLEGPAVTPAAAVSQDEIDDLFG